jgi:D-alanyl-D-alanine carboxypeptidase (penicillin-binding protein 5/6)
MKWAKWVLVSVLICCGLRLPAWAAEEPTVSAQSGILIEAQSGTVLWEKNADDRRLIASTTKIMTALVVLEQCEDLDEIVTIEPSWTGIEGSSMYLQAGQELTVRELLYGLLLASGNDAAVALACVTAGDVDSFAQLMNDKAQTLGCENSHFVNPNGLDDQEHYASARDLATITQAALNYESFVEIVSTESKTIGEQTYTNHNRLLRECSGVFGVKTGYTEAAGRSLVTCCEREGVTLICVTLSDPDDWVDHTALYDWAYERYTQQEVLSADSQWEIAVMGGEQDTVTVSPEKTLSVTCRQGQTVQVQLYLPSFVYAEVAAGQEAGTAVVLIDGEQAESVRLIYTQDVARCETPEPGLWQRLGAWLRLGERKIYTLS